MKLNISLPKLGDLLAWGFVALNAFILALAATGGI